MARVSPIPIAPRSTSSVGQIRALSAALSPLVARSQMARLTGKTFNGSRDLYEALGYPRTLTFENFIEEYERGGIAERIIEAYPRATWTGGADIIDRPETGPVEDSDTETTTEFESSVVRFFERIDFWSTMLRADILAGIGRYSVVLIGAPGALDTPLTPNLVSSADDIKWLAVYGEDRATIDDSVIITDPESDRFGEPEFYKIKLGSGDKSVPSMSLERQVHHTRVLHIAEGRLDGNLFGKPRLRGPFNYLLDLAKIVGGGSEAAWKRMDPGLHIDIDPSIELDETGEELLNQELDEYVNEVRRTIRTRGTKVTPLFANVAAFGSNVDSVVSLISATTGIPSRILTGSERGQLASTQDRNNWNDRVKERRRDFANPVLRRFINLLISLGALPSPENSYHFRWPDVESLDESAKARAISAIAAANSAQFLAEGKIIATSNELRDTYLGFGPMPKSDEPPPLANSPGTDKRFIDDEEVSASLSRVASALEAYANE